ncbi:MAG: cytochrome C [Pseudomonadota bacterium]
MFRTLAIAATTATLAVPAFADGHAASGDATEGEKAFRQCISCHVVQNEAGDTLAGRNAKTGPNLYGIIGGQFGMVEDFRYSDINQLAASMEGLTVNEEVFVAYVQDPTGYLREVTGDKGRSKMTYKVRKEEDAVNIYAYLATIAAAPDEGS